MPSPGGAFASVVDGGFDFPIFRSLNQVGSDPIVDVLMVVVTTLGATYVLALAAVPLWMKGERELALDLLVALLAASIAVEVLKVLLAVPRPCSVLPDVRLLTPESCAAESPWAFPSGHATRAFAVATVIALRMPVRVGVAGLAVAGLIGLSRIYLGLHWPSDVLGGLVIGVILAVALRGVERRVSTYRDLRRRAIAGLERVVRRPA